MRLRIAWIVSCILIGISGSAQQEPDLSADVSVADPAFPIGAGPVVVIDTAHANFHTANERFAPFASLLHNDGFVVKDGALRSEADGISPIDILVISNAYPINYRNVFDRNGIDAIEAFVERGGSLLLIADHAPFPLAVMDLAKEFGVRWLDVYATDGRSEIFRKGKGLMDHPITTSIGQVRTFGGSAFSIEEVPHVPILVMDTSWSHYELNGTELGEGTPAAGLLQGALIEHGKGRIAVFGEAAMFTAQRFGSEPIGFQAEGAEENKRFILELMRWLADRQ